MSAISEAPHKRSGLSILGIGMVIAFMLIGLSMRAPDAHADSLSRFCASVWLHPLGTAGDHCEQETQYAAHYAGFTIHNQERAGCVRGLGYYGDPQTDWVCGPRESTAHVFIPNTGGFYRGAIRNNNTVQSGWFWGETTCCYS